MKHEYIPFFSGTSKQKPDTMRNPHISCPFCDRESLVAENNIVHTDGDKLLVKNKFPVMENTYALVLVEDLFCGSDITNYPKEKLVDIIRYGLTKWLEMKNSGEFESVLFFKNHGPFSAGSIHHPHMQIIGLYDKNPEKYLDFDHLDGTVIQEEKGFEWSISHYPFSECVEFTIRMKDTKKMTLFADAIQFSTHYIINHLSTKYKSFNLCFYHVKDEIIVKVFDRRPISPLLAGYSLSQVPTNLEEIKNHIQRLYLDSKNV